MTDGFGENQFRKLYRPILVSGSTNQADLPEFPHSTQPKISRTMVTLPELLRISLSLSFSIYMEPRARGAEDPIVHLGELFTTDVPSQLTAWALPAVYPWLDSLQLIASVETVVNVDVVGDIKCEIFHHPRLQLIVVAFRGTQSMENTITDLRYIQEPLESIVFRTGGDVAASGVVHSGFHRAYLSIRSKYMTALSTVLNDSTCKQCDVLCVGHSLGGALATLAGLDLKVNSDALALGKRDVGVVTIGAPHVGCAVFAGYYQKHLRTSYRLTNRLDPVPHCLEVGKVTAAWLAHNHEPFVHAPMEAIVFPGDTWTAIGGALAGAMRSEGGFMSNLAKQVSTCVADQHGFLLYVANLEAYLCVKDAGSLDEEHAWQVARMAGGWLMSALKTAVDEFQQPAPEPVPEPIPAAGPPPKPARTGASVPQSAPPRAPAAAAAPAASSAGSSVPPIPLPGSKAHVLAAKVAGKWLMSTMQAAAAPAADEPPVATAVDRSDSTATPATAYVVNDSTPLQGAAEEDPYKAHKAAARAAGGWLLSTLQKSLVSGEEEQATSAQPQAAPTATAVPSAPSASPSAPPASAPASKAGWW